MDKLAPAIAWLKKNKFWLGSGFIALAMLGSWFYFTGVVNDTTSKRTSALSSSMSTANGILGKSAEDDVKAHPNQSTEEGMMKEMEATIAAIVEAWKKREADQKAILVWPEVLTNKKFEEVFAKFNPPETFPAKWDSGFGLDSYLELYRLQIPGHMTYLCSDKVLNTRWNADAKDEPAPVADDEEDEFSGMGVIAEESGVDMNKYAVIWSDLNQALWYDKLTQFQGKDDNQLPTNIPTPLQVYMVQQDLWLLEAMFTVIKRVNGGSTANDLSKIKVIDHVVFGRECGKDLGELTPPDMRLANIQVNEGGGGSFTQGDMPDEEMYDGDEEDMGMYDGGAGRGGPGGAAFTGRVPYDNRYVDLDFQPLPAETVRQIITGVDLPESNVELLVAKRVPFRIAMKMDEREIPRFMAECANSEFAFEIQQVRWNKHTPGGSDIDLAASDAGGGNRGGISGMGADGGGSGQDMSVGGGGPTLVSNPVEVRVNYDVNVEFYGVVKIYNPVQENLLRRAAGLEVDDSADPAAPAAEQEGVTTTPNPTP